MPEIYSSSAVMDDICGYINSPWLTGVIYESPTSIAFLDPYPIMEGHALLVPRRHVATIQELNEEERRQFGIDYFTLVDMYRKTYGDFMQWVKDGPGAGQTIPHAHWHFSPRSKDDRLWQDGKSRIVLDTNNVDNFERLRTTPENLERIAAIFNGFSTRY